MKNMMYKIILSAVFLSCRGQSVTNSAGGTMHDSYIYAFKMAYFKKLLREGFNNTQAIKDVLIMDRSGYGEPILSVQDDKLIDSLVKIDNEMMVRDSMNRVGTVAEGAQGKHVFDFALRKYQSEGLNKLAESRYQIYKRSQNAAGD